MESLIRQRWGSAVTHALTGYTAVPDVLIRSQRELRLSRTEMVVILNLLMHWWHGDGKWPYPRISTIAGRMGVTRRTVERAIKSLESKGLIIHLEGEVGPTGLMVRRFDLSGLVSKLQSSASILRGRVEDQGFAA